MALAGDALEKNSHRQVKLSVLASVFPLPIQYQSRKRNLQRFLLIGIDGYAGRCKETRDQNPRQSELSLSLSGQCWICAMEFME